MLRGSCRPQASNCVPFCSFCPALLLLTLGCGTWLDVSSEENILSIFSGFQIIKLLKLGCLLVCKRLKCLGCKSDFNFHLPLNSPSAILWHCSPVQTRRMESTKTRLRPSLLIFKAGRQPTVWRSSRTCSRVGIPAARWNIVGDPLYIPGSPANATCSMTVQPLACPGRRGRGDGDTVVERGLRAGGCCLPCLRCQEEKAVERGGKGDQCCVEDLNRAEE